MSKIVHLLLTILFALTLFSAPSASAQTDLPPGSLDPTFGEGGEIHYLDNEFSASDSTIQLDGKILLIGSYQSPRYLAVVRFNSDGALDTSFGDAGMVKYDTWNRGFGRVDILCQPNGRILAFANMPDRFTVTILGYLPNGDIDTSFNGDGEMTVSPPGAMYFNSAVLLPGGKFLMMGSDEFWEENPFGLYLDRRNADGSYDRWIFDQFATAVGYEYYYVRHLVVQPDEKVVVVGYVESLRSNDYPHFRIRRYNADLSFDREFNLPPLPDFCPANPVLCVPYVIAAAIQPGNRMLISITYYDISTYTLWPQTLVYRYSTEGAIDPSYDGDNLPTGFGGRLEIQPDGKSIHIGEIVSGSTTLVRLNLNGSRDATFGEYGVLTHTPNPPAHVNWAALTPDGKLAAIGYGGYLTPPYGARYILGDIENPGQFIVAWLPAILAPSQ